MKTRFNLFRRAGVFYPSHRKRMAAADDDDGRSALTSYTLVERLNAATPVDVQIHTGRTHQIRVHFLHIGHPVVGDDTCGARPHVRLKELTNYAAPRVLLHARDLSFEHPRTKEPVHISAPVPADFKEARKLLRLKRAKKWRQCGASGKKS